MPDDQTLELSGTASWRTAPFAFVSILWLGCLIGVSFLATPVKFQAPSLDLPTALDVGRVTFALFARTEWALCGALAAGALLMPRAALPAWGALAALIAIVLAQALWLLPILDERIGSIIAGAAVPATNHHLLYIAADVVKLLLLLGLSIWALRRLSTAGELRPCA